MLDADVIQLVGNARIFGYDYLAASFEEFLQTTVFAANLNPVLSASVPLRREHMLVQARVWLRQHGVPELYQATICTFR